METIILAKNVPLEDSKILTLISNLGSHGPLEIQYQVNKFLCDATGSAVAFCVVILPQREEMLCQVVNQAELHQDVRLPLDNPLMCGPLRTMTPVFHTAVDLHPLGPFLTEALGQTKGNLMVVPSILVGDNFVSGLFCLAVRDARFSAMDALAVQYVAKFVSGIMVHSVSSAEERRIQHHHRGLLNVAQIIFRHLDDVSVLLLEIMTQARLLTAAERCSLFLVEQHTGDLVAKVFDVAEEGQNTEEIRLPMGTGIIGQVASTGQHLNIRDAYSHPLFYKKMDEATGFRTRNILCFPIKDESRVLGVAELCNKITGSYFTPFDVEAAGAFATYCGVALVNSFMYRRLLDAQERVRLSNELMMYHMKVSDEETDQLCSERTDSAVQLFSDRFLCWSFFPRSLEEHRWPAAVITMFCELDLVNRFHMQRVELARFTLMVRRGYRDPPYHNFSHAFSVAHFSLLLVNNLNLVATGCLDHLEVLALITACLCHDLDHRGTTNSFQVASHSALASLYSSQGSVMERHHFAQAMCIVNTEGCNIFGQLTRQEYTRCLDMIQEMILATDVSQHLRTLPELRQMTVQGYSPTDQQHRRLLRNLFISCCDLSDQSKHWLHSKQTAKLVYREFFSQGDLEKEMGNNPLEMMDRERAFVPKLQIQFLDDVVLPLYSLLYRLFPGAEEVYRQTQQNRQCWRHVADVCGRLTQEEARTVDVFDNQQLDQQVLSSLYTTNNRH